MVQMNRELLECLRRNEIHDVVEMAYGIDFLNKHGQTPPSKGRNRLAEAWAESFGGLLDTNTIIFPLLRYSRPFITVKPHSSLSPQGRTIARINSSWVVGGQG